LQFRWALLVLLAGAGLRESSGADHGYTDHVLHALSCRKRNQIRLAKQRLGAIGGNDFDGVKESWWLFKNLRRNGVIGQIWPVYKWDDSPQIFALLDESGLGHAAEEMNEALRRVGVAEIELPTEAHYRRALKDFNVAISSEDAGQRLKAEIKAFYDARKDRRIKKG
jgi:hypothetical protein